MEGLATITNKTCATDKEIRDGRGFYFTFLSTIPFFRSPKTQSDIQTSSYLNALYRLFSLFAVLSNTQWISNIIILFLTAQSSHNSI